MKLLRSTLLIVFVFSCATAQLRTSTIEKLPLEPSQRWNQPQFSPDGQYLYYTTAGFDGIWEFSLATKTARVVTTDPRSGFGFAISKDGKRIAYRRTTENQRTRERIQDLVLLDLKTGVASVVATGNDVSTPVFIENELSYSAGKGRELPVQIKPAGTVILGIENTKIAVSRDGQKVLMDPFADGSYIWPSLSLDGQKIVAYDVKNGTFVCDANGSNVVRIGRLDAPSWMRNGKWIVYMDEKDDGHNITSSDIWAITPDGTQKIQLTATDNIVEMFPSCSPTENKIACSSLNGDLYVISYTEVAR